MLYVSLPATRSAQVLGASDAGAKAAEAQANITGSRKQKTVEGIAAKNSCFYVVGMGG